MVPRSVNDMRGTEDGCNGPNPTTERQDARVLESVSEKALGSTNCKKCVRMVRQFKEYCPSRQSGEDELEMLPVQ